MIDAEFAAGLEGLKAGDEVLVISWLDRAKRDILQNHPRGDPSRPVAGVFTTRSPHRPNPLGLHQVTVSAIDGARVTTGSFNTGAGYALLSENNTFVGDPVVVDADVDMQADTLYFGTVGSGVRHSSTA